MYSQSPRECQIVLLRAISTAREVKEKAIHDRAYRRGLQPGLNYFSYKGTTMTLNRKLQIDGSYCSRRGLVLADILCPSPTISGQ
jgi:hypothetical protein